MPSLTQGQIVPKLLAVLFGALVLIPLALFLLREDLARVSVESLGARAFGSLTPPGLTEVMEPTPITESVEGLGAGDGEKVADEALYPIIDGDIPFQENVVGYEYVYAGELPDLATVDPTVYRRVSTFSVPDAVTKALSELTLGVLPLSKFNTLFVSSLGLSEADPAGFSISMDPMNNNVSIYRNTGFYETYDSTTLLKQSDLLGDEALVQVAEAFMAHYGIDRTLFGEPSVDRSWMEPDLWVPYQLGVTYPLLVGALEAWGIWGQPSGMSVMVNIRTMSVDSFSAPGPFTLEGSTYELTTDAQAVLKLAKQGGLWEVQPENPDTLYSATLGEPEVVMAEHSLYDEKTGGQTVLYVPALRFPVVDIDEQAPYKKQSVVVPLIRDLLGGDPKALEPVILEETK